jgi:hypothetical protein
MPPMQTIPADEGRPWTALPGVQDATGAIPCTPGKLGYLQFLRGDIDPDCHQNLSFCQLSTGDVLVSWYACGLDECSNSGIQLCTVSKDRGLTWSDPQVDLGDYLARPLLGHMICLRNGGDVFAVLRGGPS